LQPSPVFSREEVILLVDDFESGQWKNLLGGQTGVWERSPLGVEEFCRGFFVSDERGERTGSILQLRYSLSSYAYNGYASKLNGLDLRPYESISFWVRGGKRFRPSALKIEIKSNHHRMSYRLKGTPKHWQKVVVPLRRFRGYEKPEYWRKVTELTIVFEGQQTKPPGGSVYFDDIAFAASPEYFESQKVLIDNEMESVRKEMLRISELPEDELLDIIERKTFDYFWYQVSPATYLTKDRDTLGSSCSIGATGFGLTILCIGCERGWVKKRQAYRRVVRTLRALNEDLQREHGFYYHWVNSVNSQRDGRSELSSVDTALLLGGVLTVRQYFGGRRIRRLCDEIFQTIDWPWMFGEGSDSEALYMGWTPERGFRGFIRWDMFAEEMMMYLLGLGSPTYPLPEECWDAFARPMKEGPAGTYLFHDGESMFVYTYSHAWVDFRNRHDQYADYWENSVRAIRANYEFCNKHADEYRTYGEGYWGISASDGPSGYVGYGAVSGMHDGTIPPYSLCAAVPFAPDISIPAIRKLLREYGDRVWGEYGFVSAFNLDKDWFSCDHIGIDEGIILLMLENYRTGFVWKYFMSNPYIKEGMKRAGFKSGITELNVVRLKELEEKKQKEMIKALPGITASAVGVPVTIDTQLEQCYEMVQMNLDTSLEFGEVENSSDLGSSFGFCWDDQYLYFGIRVIDDIIMAREKNDEIYRGDCVELYIDPVSGGKNFVWGDSRYFQIGFAPDSVSGKPAIWAWFQGCDPGENIKFAARDTENGYNIEAAIKWEFLGIKPESGVEFGMSAAVHDVDEAGKPDKKLNWCFRKTSGKIALGKLTLQ